MAELIFKVQPDLNGAEDFVVSSKRVKLCPQKKPLLAISVRNLVAFSSHVDLSKKKPRNKKTDHGTNEESDIVGTHVYVADLNTPWETYLVKNSACQVTHLSWDHAGGKLLIGTDEGHVEVYTMTEHLLNKWHLVFGAVFSGEPILIGMWLALPRKVSINMDKLESMVYSEKYSVSVPPSSRGFGGKPLDGCVVVTGTGLVGALVCNSCGDDSSKILQASEKIIAVRSQILFADTAYAKDGDVVTVTCDDNLKKPIFVNKIKVSLISSRDKAEVKISSAQSLFLPFLADHAITSVQFGNKFNTEHLLITMGNRLTGTSWMCLYELVVQPVTLKSRFQSSTSDSLATYRWQQSAQIQLAGGMNYLCMTPSQLISPSVGGNGGSSSNSGSSILQSQSIASTLSPLIATALSNGSIILSRADNLQQVGTIGVNPSNASGIIKLEKMEETDTKKNSCKFANDLIPSSSNFCEGGLFSSMGFSWSGSVLVGLTATSHIYSYKLHPNLDASTSATLIEMSMMGGLDPWDIMMCIRPSLIDSITDRLSETFARQLPSVQTHYNARMLVIKAALYRMASGGTARINDQQTLLMLYLVSGALKALLRPGELSSHEKGPGESLTTLLSSKGESFSDLNKVLVHVVAKEYTVEASTLQSLQQFLQWCADLALKLLSTLPDLRHSRAPGWEVCRDSKAITTLRELIVLMRIWGLIRPSCLPAFRKTSDSLDVLPLLFRLLTRLSVAPHDPDESLIDECCLLPSEVQIPNHTAYCPTKSLGLASSAISSSPTPHQFRFGVFPLKWWVGVETNGNWMDGLRLLWLGKNPTGVKICNRCGCTTLSQLGARSLANKAWDNRWVRCCPCGGHWKIPTFLPQPKAVDTDSFLNF